MQSSRAGLLFTTMLAASWLCSAQSGSAEQRSGVGPCRQGVLALIGMLDSGDVKSAELQECVFGRGRNLRTRRAIESRREARWNGAVQKARRLHA